MNSLNPGAMAGSATLFCVTEIVSSFETHHTFGVPKRFALKALQKAFLRAAFESSKVTVLEGLPNWL